MTLPAGALPPVTDAKSCAEQCISLEIPVSELLQIGTNGGIMIVPAQGVGTVIVPFRIILSMKFQTTPYVFQDYLDLYMQTAMNTFGMHFNILDSGSNNAGMVTVIDCDMSSSGKLVENMPLGLIAGNGTNPINGDSTLKVVLYYKVITF